MDEVQPQVAATVHRPPITQVLLNGAIVELCNVPERTHTHTHSVTLVCACLKAKKVHVRLGALRTRASHQRIPIESQTVRCALCALPAVTCAGAKREASTLHAQVQSECEQNLHKGDGGSAGPHATACTVLTR